MNLAFDFERRIDVDLVRVGLQVGDFFRRDQSGALLRLGERHPYGAPQFAAFLFGKERA
jgi:hypothetical protein